MRSQRQGQVRFLTLSSFGSSITRVSDILLSENMKHLVLLCTRVKSVDKAANCCEPGLACFP